MTLSPTARMRAALTDLKGKFAERFDSWANPITGIGTTRDKSTYGYIQAARALTDVELSALYHTDDMAARMVDVIPQEMLREGFYVETGTPDDDTILADKFSDLDVRGKMQEASRWGRCFGGAGLLLGCDDGQDADQPLNPERAKDLSYLYVIDRRLLWPVSYYNEPGDPKLGLVKTYMVSTITGEAQALSEVHESRLVIFRGAPTGAREKLQLASWDYSVLQRPYEILRQFNTGWRAVETLLTDGNQAIFKMAGLAEILAAPDGQALLNTRMQAMDMMRSVLRALVIDAGQQGGMPAESFERQAANFSGIPDTLEKFMLRLAAAVQIPVTILMGQSPAGLNATGDNDFRWFYDRIRAEQTTMLAPKIKRVADVWMATKAGRQAIKRTPKALTVKFPPLWTETPLVAAQRETAIAQRDAVYIQAQVITPEEVALQRFRPEGFSDEIQLTPEAKKAREDALKEIMKSYSAAPAASDQSQLHAGQRQATEAGEGDMTTPAEKTINAKPLNDEEGRLDASDIRTFSLERDQDDTGVSGTGLVAVGALFPDGRVAVRWRTETASTTLFDSMDEMTKVHGHGGKTRVVWDD